MYPKQLIIKKKNNVTINDFLKQYEEVVESSIQNLFNLDFQLKKQRSSEKIITTLHIAKQDDAKDITKLFKEVYQGSYPYKRMESVEELQRMIESSESEWLLFKSNSGELAGCFGADFQYKKKALLHGFIIRNKYRHIIDSLKAFVGSLIYYWNTYKDKIPVWIAEVRTNSVVPQWATNFCGLKPIAFFPNKDIFFNKIESDFLHVAYFKEVLNEYRSKKIPKLIREVLNCYAYSTKRYNLGVPLVENPKLKINSREIEILRKKINKAIINEKFNYQIIKYSIGDSFFKFKFNPYSKSIEHTMYQVNSLEELSAFLLELKNKINLKKINYFQCFISAYKPEHQKLFLEMGFKPRGYIPCWECNENENIFKDFVLFNYFLGDINKNIKLTKDSEELFRFLGFSEEAISDDIIENILSYK